MLTSLSRVFQPRVSFDTFDKPADFIEESSFTLIAKHKDYEYTKRSRTFLCGFDENEYSVYALQWLINELVDDGDEIVCLRVVEKEDAIAGDRSVETGRYRVEAEHTMADIQSRNHDNKAINLILEFSIGKVNKVIDDMVSFRWAFSYIMSNEQTDQSLRAGNFGSRDTRQESRWIPGTTSGQCVQVLSTAFTSTCHRCPSHVEARQSKEQAHE